jgi:hypothetical protein
MIKYEIEPFDWQYKLDQLSIALENKVAHVKVTGLNLENQIGKSEMKLTKLSYDNHNDILELMFEQLNHLIEAPLTICFQQQQNILEAIEIFDDNANKTIIVFSDPFLVTHHQ